MSNICFLINNISRGAGTERMTTMLANELCKNHNIYIYSCREGYTTEFFVKDEVKVVALGGEQVSNPITRKVYIRKKLANLFAEQEIDIAIAVDLDMCLYFYSLKGCIKRLGIKTVGWEHFNYYYHQGLKGLTVKHIATNFCDALIVLGLNDFKTYKDKVKRIKNIQYIYNPLAVSIEEKKIEEKIVLSVGRLEVQKGFDLLLNAWCVVEKECPDWKLKIVGSGSQQELLIKIIEDNKLKNVEMIPYTNNIEDYYEKAGVYVLSSRFEGFVLVLLEAQAKGLPVVSFNCPEGPKEIIQDGVNGYLVENGNVEELASRIIELINDEDKRRSFSKHSQDNLDRFSIESVVPKWLDLIDELVGV